MTSFHGVSDDPARWVDAINFLRLVRCPDSLVEAAHEVVAWHSGLWLTTAALFSQSNKALFSVAAGHFVVDYSAALPNMMYPFLFVSLGLSNADVGAAAAIFTLSNSLAQPLFGYAGDRIGHRYVAAVGLVMQGVFIGSLAFVWNLSSLVILLALAGIFTGMFHPVGAAVANRAAPTRKGASVGTFFIGGTLGFGISPFIAANVFEEIGLIYATFMILPALIVGLAVFKFASVIHPPAPEKTFDTEVAPYGPMDVRALAVLIWVVFFRSYAFSGMAVFIPLFVRSTGSSIQSAGLALTLFLSGFAVGTLAGGTLADRIGTKPVVVISLALVAPLVLMFAYAPGSPVALAAIVLGGLLLAGSFTPTIVMIQEQLPKLLGAATGVALGFTFASGAVGQWATGGLADAFGYQTAFAVLAVAPILSALGGTLMAGSMWPRRAIRRPA